MADAGKRLMLRVVDGTCCALFPVTGGLPHLDRLPHAVLDALGVLPGVAFAVVADENRLTKRDMSAMRWTASCARCPSSMRLSLYSLNRSALSSPRSTMLLSPSSIS